MIDYLMLPEPCPLTFPSVLKKAVSPVLKYCPLLKTKKARKINRTFCPLKPSWLYWINILLSFF